MAESFPVKQVEGIDPWAHFRWVHFRYENSREHPVLRGILRSSPRYNHVSLPKLWYVSLREAASDVVDYYTTSDGTLKIPPWASFKFAVDEYLAEAPALKFHPSRVRAFIEENGVDHLDHME